MMDSNGQTRDLLSRQIKNEFECDIIYEPLKREIVEDSSKNELDHDHEDDVFYDTIEPCLTKKVELQNNHEDFEICKSEKDIVENKTKLVEEEPCKSLESDLKNALENPTYEVDCDQKEGILIMNMINENFSLENEANSGHSKNSLIDKVKCKPEIEDDIEIVYEDITWEDSSENNAKVISEVCNKSFGKETDLINHESDTTDSQGQNKVNLDSTDDVIQGESSSKEKTSCSSVETATELHGYEDKETEEDEMIKQNPLATNIFPSTLSSKLKINLPLPNLGLSNFNQNPDLLKHEKFYNRDGSIIYKLPPKCSGVLSILHADVDKETVIKQNLSTSKDEIKMLKVLLHPNFGLGYPNQNNGDGLLIYDLPLKFNNLKYPNRFHKERFFQCKHCSKSFINESSMLRHYRCHSEEKPQCAICSITFHSKHNLLIHTRIIHNDDLLFQCKLCSKYFIHRFSLLRHERIHKRINPYHCKVCPRSFYNKTVFTRHEKSHKEKLFNCNLCSKTFRESSILDNHIRNHNQKPFHCTSCPKSFCTRCNLARHERIHKGEKPYRCKYCPKAFADPAHLPVHERTHTGERPFLCKVCSKSFTQSCHLRIHVKIHIGERPFTCKICSRSFIHKRTLSIHGRVHKSLKERFRDDKYHCKFCSKSFPCKTFLDMHENTHDEEKRFRCKFCSKSYSAKSSLVAHEKNHKHKKNKSEV